MQKIKTFYPRVLNQKAVPILLMAPFALLLAIALVGQFILAYAADEPVGLGAAVMALFGAIQSKAVTAVIIMHVFQILRTNEAIGILGKLGLSGRGLQIAVAILTTLGYIANAWATSGNLGAAAIEGLFTAGGAMLIFDAFKANAQAVAEKQGEIVVAAVIQKKAGKALS